MNETARLSVLTSQDLMVLGMEHFAYVKPVEVEGVTAYAVHAADGTRIAVMASRELAIATIRHHELDPVSVH